MLIATTGHYFAAAAIGLVAGLVGGLAGIGGSLIILPALAIIFHYDDSARTEQHAFQAAAMLVNIVVAIPATWQHRKAGVFRRDLLAWVVPSMSAMMIVGVLMSNHFDGRTLQRILAGLIAWDCGVNLYRLLRRTDESALGGERGGPPLMILAGSAAGLAGGLAGLGGGVLVVPVLQLMGRVPLKQAIATSAAAMCVSSAIGATIKLSTLHEQGRDVGESLMLALLLAPGAILGSYMGAALTHRLPVQALRLVVSGVLLAAAAKLAVG